MLIVQFALTHSLVLLLTGNEPSPLNVVLAGLLGILLTANVTRGVWGVERTIKTALQMGALHAPKMLPFDPMVVLIRPFQSLEGGQLRTVLVQQTRDAAAQEERNRMARELHDSIKQQLFTINVSAAAVDARLDHDLDGARAALQDVRGSVKEAMVEMNALLQQLSPAPLERVGLVQAMHDQAEALGYRTGATVTVDMGHLPDDVRLQHGTQEALFRITQEALSNVARHARASHVALQLAQSGDVIKLVITDNGQGFDPKMASGGMGLANMQSRLEPLGGQMKLTSERGQGTTLHISIPLVDPILLEEQIMVDHTINRVFAAGIIGGILLMAALFIPFYVIIPGTVIDDWPQVSAFWMLPTTIAALVIVVGTGTVGARFGRMPSRSSSAIAGATAGGTAALLAYFGVVAASVGILASEATFDYGLQAARDDQHMIDLFTASIDSIYLWAYGTFWLILLAGLGLGTLGGWLARPASHALNIERLVNGLELLVVTLMLFSVMTMTITMTVFPIVESELGERLSENGYDTSGLFVISALPIGTAFAIFFGVLMLGFWKAHYDLRGTNVEQIQRWVMDGPGFALYGLSTVAFLLLLEPWQRGVGTISLAFIGVCILLTLIVAGFYLRLARRSYHRLIELTGNRPNLIEVAARDGWLLALWSMMTGSLVLVVLPFQLAYICLGIFVMALVLGGMRDENGATKSIIVLGLATLIALLDAGNVVWFGAGLATGFVAFMALQRRISITLPPSDLHQVLRISNRRLRAFAGSMLGCIVTLLLVVMSTIHVWLPQVIILVAAIPYWAQYEDTDVAPPSNPTTLAEIGQNVFLGFGQTIVIVLIGILVLSGMGLLFGVLFNFSVRRRIRKEASSL